MNAADEIERLRFMLWNLCHAIGNGDYEHAEDLADEYQDEIDGEPE